MIIFIIGFIAGILFVELNRYLAREFEELARDMFGGERDDKS